MKKSIIITLLLLGFCSANAYSASAFVHEGRYGIKSSANYILLDEDYEYIEFIRSDVAKVKKNGKYGLVKITSNEHKVFLTNPSVYNDVKYMKGDLFLVDYNGKKGIIQIGRNSTRIIPVIDPIYDSIRPYQNMYKVKFHGRYGIARLENNKFDYVVKPTYSTSKEAEEALMKPDYIR